jgi:alanyl-tRNA synthetase
MKYFFQDQKSLITIPGENYPEKQLSVIHTPISVEPCCGTHVHSTADVHSLVVTSIKTVGPGARSMKCFVGSGTANWLKSHLQLFIPIYGHHFRS